MIRFEPPNNSILKGNELKDFVQNDIACIDNPHILAECFTGFGKTRIGVNRIKYLARTNPNLIVNIVVPKEHLLNSWKEACRDLYKDFPFVQINMYIINSYTMSTNNTDCDLLIIDEVHRALNDASEYFSTAIAKTKFKYSLFLTATLKPSHQDYLVSQFNKLSKTLVKYTVTLYWGWKNDLVPPTKIYNIPLSLSLTEKSNYIKANDDIRKYQSYFAQFGVYNPYDMIRPTAKSQRESIARKLNQKEGQVFGSLMNWQKAIGNRNKVIEGCAAKYSCTLEILSVLQQKALVFCASIDFSNLIETANSYAIAYHSKLKVKEKKEVLEQFYSNKKPFLISINALKEGFDITSCQIGIRTSYNANELDMIQQLGE